jgi:hypothetical protein
MPPDRKRVNVDLAGRVGGVSAASAISWVTDWPERGTMNASDTTWA